MSTLVQRRLPIGAETWDGGTHFRVWAPRRQNVEVVIEGSRSFELQPEDGGYFSGFIESARSGDRYRYRLDPSEKLYPDPASRFQPTGPHGPSQIVDPNSFQWSDRNWPGIQIKGQIFYELHVGTFTKEGTWEAARAHLPELADLGVTAIEVMPVADFPGSFGWGYDGVCLFAPANLYGSPDDFRRFVDHAHSLHLAVTLDVVYNHFGPDGNHLKEFSEFYFTHRYDNEWGDAINFDGPHSGPVREFFAANVCYWIQEFHIDGLRFDATQQIFDKSPEYVVAQIVRESRRATRDRSLVFIAEDETQRAILATPTATGGCGLDGVWNDDFHHAARVALTKRNEAYYSGYRGTPQEFISALKWGYLYQGEYYAWQKKRRGTPALQLSPPSFVTYLQNHDQVANSATGERLHKLTSPALYRALTTLLLIGPNTPMLFQGQEFSASTPFHFFADHNPSLAPLVQKGRTEFMKQFASIVDSKVTVPTVNDRRTFEECKIDHSERAKNGHTLALHRDLIRLRRNDPVFNAQRSDWMHGCVITADAFALRFFGGENGDRLIVVNLGGDLPWLSVAEPLLAPPSGLEWKLIWSSEWPQYGGCGREPMGRDGMWSPTGESAVILRSETL